MNEKEEKQISLDILKHVEELSNKVNKIIEPRAKTVFARYPIAFGLLILIGVTALHEGLKGIMEYIGLFGVNPLYPFVVGLLILLLTGTLYIKLEK